MKKNKMMRIASVLLIVTILSTCAISGTFAKYVTSATVGDNARVAKWGINIAMEGNTLFADQYDFSTGSTFHGRNNAADVAVKAAVPVVAPGTSSAEAGGDFSARISGTPEVAVRYQLSFDNFTDIVLTEGDTIKDETGLADLVNGDFVYPDYVVPYTYTPVKWTIKFVGYIGANTTEQTITLFDGISLTDAQNILDGEVELPASLTYNGISAYVDGTSFFFDAPAGKAINGVFTAEWKWDFENLSADKMDTYLGNHAESYPLAFTFSASATQID